MDWESFTAFDTAKREQIQNVFKKIRNEETLTEDDEKIIVEFADIFITVSLKDVRTEHIVRDVLIHHHTKTCKKHGPKCRFYFPRFPTRRTIISVPYKKLRDLTKEQQEERLERSRKVLNQVQEVLENEEAMKIINSIGIEEINQKKIIQRKMLNLEKIIHKLNESKHEAICISKEAEKNN